MVLGLDTATAWGCLGLIDDGEVLAETCWRVERNQAERFFPALDETMSRAGCSPGDLDLIAVGCGPGSYTGLRIGLAIGRALSFSLDKPLAGVGTLRALAENAGGYPGPVCAVLPSRRGEMYAAIYENGAELVPPAPFTAIELMERANSLDRPEVLVLGPAAHMLHHFNEQAGVSLAFGRPEQGLPRGAAVARLGREHPEEPARPAYLRPTGAEQRLGGQNH